MSAVFENIKSQHEEIMHRIEGAAKRAHRQVHDMKDFLLIKKRLSYVLLGLCNRIK